MATDISESQELKTTEINKYNFRTETEGVFKARKGIDEEIINQISDIKNEPDWMRQFRLEAFKIFESKPMPEWGGDISLDFQDIFYYLKPTKGQGKTWDEVPEEIKDTFEKLGIPEAERKRLVSGLRVGRTFLRNMLIIHSSRIYSNTESSAWLASFSIGLPTSQWAFAQETAG